MPKTVDSGLLPYFYKKSTTVLTGYRIDIPGIGSQYYVANNEDVGSYTALAIKRDTITSEDGTVLNEIDVGLDNTELDFKQWVMQGALEGSIVYIKLLFTSKNRVGHDLSISIYGSVDLYIGVLDAPKGDENWISFSVRPFGELDREYPSRLYQLGCNWLFCGSGCGLTLGNYDYSGTLSAESDGTTLSISHGQAENYFVPGYAEILDGDYAGEYRPILSNTTTGVTLRVAFEHTIPNGTAIKLQKLCAKTPDACQTIFSNYDNYGGFPHVPQQPII
jgi:hypothetical protein